MCPNPAAMLVPLFGFGMVGLAAALVKGLGVTLGHFEEQSTRIVRVWVVVREIFGSCD
jgi:hypothetical protein